MNFLKTATVIISLFFILTLNRVYGNSFVAVKENASSAIEITKLKAAYGCNRTYVDNEPPVLLATGNQVYCPGSAINIVTTMSITDADPGDNSTLAVYIQISSGYVNNQDLLTLTGNHPTIVSSWDAAAGKLTLQSPTSLPVLYTNFEAAIEDVVFSNSSASPSGTRTFSITIGEANYLPSTGHYYEYIPSIGITWTSARALADTADYYGLQGYLATLTSVDEAQLCGEQASGAGWIGGTDEETEGVWKWVTGPETGTVFWNGQVNGTTPNFAFWNNSEPNNLGEEDYAHITAPGVGILGSWNDLTNIGSTSGDYQPKGYIVEYGGTPGDPILNISASTILTIPQITASTDATNCGPGFVTLIANANAGTVKWYDSLTSTTPIAIGSTFTTPIIMSTTSYYADAFEVGCTTATRTTVTATIIEIPVLSVLTSNVQECEGSVLLQASTTIGTIRWYDSDIGGTLVENGSDFNTPSITEDTTFYVQSDNNGCISGLRIPVLITIFQKPTVVDEEITICENGVQSLDAGITGVTYNWSRAGETTKTITVAAPGTYTVTVTNPQNCSNIKTFTVIEKFAPVISDVIVNGTSVTIVTSNAGEFEYSVDGNYYQPSPIFTVDTPGLNTAYVREVNFCGNDNQEFIVIIVPLFFTPNNDGFNDNWTIPGIFLYPDAQVGIYDRYGKLVCELNKTNLTWNGTYNGLPLPSNDYWFILKLDALAPELRGHFSLVR